MRAYFRCIAGCAGSYPLTDVRYRCPTCSDLLEVAHDVDALRGQDWKQIFAARAVESSGVWAKREWIAPDLPADAVVTLGEGNTALQPLPRYAAELGVADVRIKQCGTSHTGSFKDLGMTVLVSYVNHIRRTNPGAGIQAIACASTGDTSAALAAYAAAAGIPAVVILPRGKISPAQLVQPLACGAKVLALDTDFDGCMAIVQRLAAEGLVYLANSMNSLRLEGQKTVAIEICQQLGWTAPDWIVIPGGNLGNVSALGAGLDLLLALGLIPKAPRLCVAQTAGAAPLYHSYQKAWAPLEPVAARPTLASAIQIGNPVSFTKAVRALQNYDGVVEIASEDELTRASARADRHGMYTCPHTGVALAALEKLVARGEIAKTDRVVVVSTASGLKFTDFKVSAAPAPIELPADFAAVSAALAAASA